MTDLSKASRAAEQAAYAAGTHLQASRSQLVATLVTHRSPEEVLAIIESDSLTLIRDVVLKHFPEHGFVGGPGNDDDKLRAAEMLDDGRPHWIVDPLDGTANYLRGYPQYAVSIAFVELGEPQIGVVYDPCRNEFFGAIRGRGAVLNGLPIRCSPGRPAIESMAATVFPQATNPRMPLYMAELGRVLRNFSGARRSGSMALELAYLASARIDAFWAHDKNACDAAAGIVLLRESGALIHARDGRQLLASRSLLACTPTLFEPFLSLLAEV
jgi:myo-inositol-1(or 4)-monophosphatase